MPASLALRRPLAQLVAQPLGLGQRLDADQRRGHARAGRARQPVLREHPERRGVVGLLGHAVAEDGVADELGMTLPLEPVLAEFAEEVGRAGLGVSGTEAVEQLDQVRPVGLAVARRGVLGLLDGEVDRAARRREAGEGARVQLVGELVAQRVILDRDHRRHLAPAAAAAKENPAQPHALNWHTTVCRRRAQPAASRAATAHITRPTPVSNSRHAEGRAKSGRSRGRRRSMGEADEVVKRR